MLERLSTVHLCSPAGLPPSREGFEVVGVFNPAAVASPTKEHPHRLALLVRVAERPAERRPGFHACPRYAPDGEIATDWIDAARVDSLDPRQVVFKDTGFKRLTFTSHLRVAFSHTGERLDELGGVLEPFDPASGSFNPLAGFGYEDPRLTVVDGGWLVTAVGASEHGVVTDIFRTDPQLASFERIGTAFCRENKDVVLFPETIAGRYVAIHRPTGGFQVKPAEMWLASSPDLVHWGGHRPLYGSAGPGRSTKPRWDDGRVGGGVPPIRTDAGWLVVYHASCRPKPGEPIGVYAAGALLLDHDDPAVIKAATPEPFMVPEHGFETAGFVNAVVFPTGYALHDGVLSLVYGAADTHVGVVRYRLRDVLAQLAPWC